MTDRPILFSAPMVRAILAGQKTQTRRAVKPHPAGEFLSLLKRPIRAEADPCVLRAWFQAGEGEQSSREVTCPYGQPGDRLWVRESHWFFQDEADPVTGYTPPVLTTEDVEYRADGESTRHGWRPSIHMPRWASRITMNVTGVRVERLQSISEDDARAEGVDYDPGEGGVFWVPGLGCTSDSAAESFRLLWKSVNGAESWDANPWVWVVEFQRAEA
jgi:hypothetical protein